MCTSGSAGLNLAGKVTIIGYYSSEDILTAVEKGVISVTCDVDTEQLGRYSIEALTAYQKDGRTNSYYNVDINFLDKNAVRGNEKEGGVWDEAAALERFHWSVKSL
mgnify:CR=1 FL=1